MSRETNGNGKFDLERLLPELRVFALSLTKDPDDAEDVLQEACCRMCVHRDKYESGTNFRAWAYKVVRNTFINDYRKRMCRPECFIEEWGGAENENPVEPLQRDLIFEDEMSELVSDVTPLHSKVVILWSRGFSQKEISNRLQMPLGTVASRTRRGLRKLSSPYFKNRVYGSNSCGRIKQYNEMNEDSKEEGVDATNLPIFS